MGFVGRKPTNAPLTSSDLGTGIVGSTNIADGTIVNDDINANAAIASSKLSITSPLSITGNATAGSEIRLPEDTDNGSNYVAIKAPDTLASNLTLTLPSADGSANQALVTNGSGVLSFAAVGASAGQVIQVVSATDSTERSTTSTSFVTASNTLSASITPSATANKILILVATGVRNDTRTGHYTVYRGATDLGAASNKGMTLENGDAGGIAINYLDSPSTTSSTTYQVYFRTNVNDSAAYLNSDFCKGSIILMEIKG